MASRTVQTDPDKMQFSLPASLVVIAAGMYVGGKLAEKGAAFLEENEIFVPDDDDDD